MVDIRPWIIRIEQIYTDLYLIYTQKNRLTLIAACFFIFKNPTVSRSANPVTSIKSVV
jgi:hypothetical protein